MSIFSFRPKAADRPPRPGASAGTPREARLQSAFEAAPAGLAIATIDGRWLQVNEACCQLLGYARNELVHYSLMDLTHPEDAGKEMQLIRRVLAGDQRQYRIEKRVIDKSGDYRELLVSATIIHGNGGESDAFVYVIEPQQSSGESGNDAGRMAMAILDGLGDVAVIRTDSRGMITGWNRGAERILGYTRTEVLGKNRRMLYRDGDNWDDAPLTQLQAAAEEGHHVCDDFRIARDGSHLWLHSAIFRYAPDGMVRGYVEVLSFRNEAAAAIDMKPMLDRMRGEIDEARGANEALKHEAETRDQELRILAAALRDEIERRNRAEGELDELRDLRALEQLSIALPTPEPQSAPEVVPEAATTTLEIDDEPPWNTLESARPLDLLIDAAANRRTGALIVTDGTWHKALFFLDGRLSCIASDDPGDFLGERLVRSGVISEAQRTKTLQLANATDLAFGRCLVILGVISDDLVAEALRAKIEDDVEVLSTWEGCSWSFVDREPPHRKLLLLSIDVYELRAVREAIGAHVVRGLRAVDAPEPAPAKRHRYVATRSGGRYHRLSCKTIRRTPEEDHVAIASKKDAKGRGLEPCGVCLR